LANKKRPTVTAMMMNKDNPVKNRMRFWCSDGVRLRFSLGQRGMTLCW